MPAKVQAIQLQAVHPPSRIRIRIRTMPSVERLRALARQLSGRAQSPGPRPAAAVDEQPLATASHEPILFNDRQMQDFVREGYVMFHLDDLPKSYHDGVMETLDKAFERGGNPGNNMLRASHSALSRTVLSVLTTSG